MYKPFGAFRIAAAYISTVVGAGFASGQEILRFFSAYGIAGFAGIVLSSALFFFFGYSAIALGKALNASSYFEIVRFTNGRILGSAVDIIITVFLFGALAVMFAGAGAVFREQFGLAPVWGTLIMAFISFITVITGTKGVVNAISAIVPALIISVVAAFFGNIGNPILPGELKSSMSIGGATPDWFLSSFNYASYNIVIAVAVLSPVGAKAKSVKSIVLGALFGAAGLGLCMVMINYCLLSNIEAVCRLEVPMLKVTSQLSSVLRLLFSFVIFSEIYSTATGNLYGFSRRVSLGLPKNLIIALATAGAFAAGQLGFSNLVRYLYPAVGYAALIFFAGTVRRWFVNPGLFLPGRKK